MAYNITEIAVDGGTKRTRDLPLGKKLRKTIDKLKAGTLQQEALKEVESFYLKSIRLSTNSNIQTNKRRLILVTEVCCQGLGCKELDIPKEKLVEMYRKMFLIRNFEYTLNRLYATGKIVGDLHLYVGEEAVAVGVLTNLRNDDYVISTHRGHGHCLAKGSDLNKVMAEFYGKRDGLCKGKGGSMHLADVSVGILGASGIVGGGLPLATGAGLSAKYRGTDQVTVCFFGDGASNQGTFHESINLASIWDLPVIFVCENNQYAESTPVTKAMRIKNVADRAVSYGIPGIVVDGTDVTAVYQETEKAVARARQGNGPTLLECKTYRYESHEIGDPQQLYRPKEEVEAWKARDPIPRLKKTLVSSNILTEKDVEKLEQEVLKQIDDAIKFAEASPDPDPETAFQDVFVEPYY